MIITKPVTPEYEESWERVFRKSPFDCGIPGSKEGDVVRFKIRKLKLDVVATDECKCTTTSE